VCLIKTSLEELVFAIPTNILWQLLPYKKKEFLRGSNEILKSIVQNGLFRERCKLEEDPSFKQIIPYSIISCNESFYLFRRTSGQREKRLHNKLHLGVGGHMNPVSSMEPNEKYLVNELKRELFEEVILLNGCLIEDIEFIGFINDDTTSVSRVHIGLLYIISLSNKDVIINETDKMTAGWIDKTDISEYYNEMETWTKIAIDYLLK